MAFVVMAVRCWVLQQLRMHILRVAPATHLHHLSELYTSLEEVRMLLSCSKTASQKNIRENKELLILERPTTTCELSRKKVGM